MDFERPRWPTWEKDAPRPSPNQRLLSRMEGSVSMMCVTDDWNEKGRHQIAVLAALCLLLNVEQHSHVNLMHDLVGPFAPIYLRPEVVLIPCRSLQQCLVIAQRY